MYAISTQLLLLAEKASRVSKVTFYFPRSLSNLRTAVFPSFGTVKACTMQNLLASFYAVFFQDLRSPVVPLKTGFQLSTHNHFSSRFQLNVLFNYDTADAWGVSLMKDWNLISSP